MKSIKLKSIVLTMVFGLMLIVQSCNKNNEPSLANINMEMKATTTLGTISSGRAATADLVFTQVLLGVKDMEFETLEESDGEDNGDNDIEDSDGDGEDDNEDIEFEGPYIVDLLAGTSTPDFGGSDIAPGLYEQIEIEMGPVLDGDLTMFVAFNYTPTGAVSPVSYEFSTSEEIEYEIEKEAGFLLDEGALNQMLIIFNLDSLFSNIDFSTATADLDGVVRINSRSNTDIYAVLISNFQDSMEGGEDNDDDGEFDD